MKYCRWKNLNFVLGERSEILNHLLTSMMNNKLFIVTANMQILDRFMNDDVYRKCLERASFVVPDGVGAKLLLKKVANVSVPRYPGVELMQDLCSKAAERGLKVYLLGAREEVVIKTAEVLNTKHSRKIVVGYHHGYFDEGEEQDLVDEVNNSEADMLFVGMGVPKQEEFICRNMDRLNVKLMMGVGGSFDVISGTKTRAPAFMRNLGLEWLYRVLQEPHKRYKVMGQFCRFAFRLLKEGRE